MNTHDTLYMMRRCSSEIKELRRQISTLTPKAEAYEMLRQTLSMMPQLRQGMGEDLSWTLDREADRLEAALKKDEKAEVLGAEQ